MNITTVFIWSLTQNRWDVATRKAQGSWPALELAGMGAAREGLDGTQVRFLEATMWFISAFVPVGSVG